MLCRTLHTKCRDSTKPYLRSRVYRIPVKDDQVPWDSDFGECSYLPKDYTAKTVHGKTWADHEDPCIYTFNHVDDDGINRLSFNGLNIFSIYSLDSTGRPLNPFGRTGLRGRGVLGKWGPNHAADAIVSRYIIGENGKQIPQFVAIDLAIPGGMIDPDEDAREAAIREFHEEALSNNVLDEKLTSIWRNGKTVYQGYVDDPRNTDNSWMETSCFNFHDTTGNLLKDLNLKVDNLPYNTSVHELRRLFDRYGDIGDVYIPRDRYNNQSRGFGFVRFYSRKDADYACSRADGKQMNGRELRVSIAKYRRPLDEGRDRDSRCHLMVVKVLIRSIELAVYEREPWAV
uniref:Uncharacterized protein n=1 Tax=Meloidogyne javanica TaxID=6303 RepID=A0A915M6X9_MELJA